ncbi:hypothetical protein IW262DRAFT_202667 [Armillaria fumosa]|nr:hypothetical protein IW262DRAFT_202667 [Armillaria fumosa]
MGWLLVKASTLLLSVRKRRGVLGRPFLRPSYYHSTGIMQKSWKSFVAFVTVFKCRSRVCPRRTVPICPDLGLYA